MPSLAVRPIAATLALTGVLLYGGLSLAQEQPKDPAPPRPYKKVAVSLPVPIADASFDAFRKRLGEIAERKDRAALATLIVSKGFFWEQEGGQGVDEKKSGIDNFAAATGLDSKDGSGWEFLADYAAEPTASPVEGREDMACTPGSPKFNDDEFVQLVKDTETNPIEWGYPLKDGIEVREDTEPNSKPVEKLGLHFVRVVFDEAPPDKGDAMLRIVTPSGKLAFMAADMLSPLGIDQLCYVKQSGAWKIAGYIGEGPPH